MIKVMVLGAGKIGSLISDLLAETGDYQIFLLDIEQHPEIQLREKIQYDILDAQNLSALEAYIKKQSVNAVISALPYYCNPDVAALAKKYNLHYFDLTEDVEVTNKNRQLAQDAQTAFIPQCGLAPGFISIAAQNLIHNFDKLDKVKMRVGALPINPSNALKYSLTWSTDGLINEYGNMCYGILDGRMTELLPLEGYETIELDGLLYEAFNTSGGLGTLADTYEGEINSMNYKTLRYPGHCEKIRLLMNDLKMNQDRDTLKRILENAIPKTLQDVVLIYVSVSGWKGEYLYEETYVKKVYPQEFLGKTWSAIQVTTASGICCAVDLVLQNQDTYKGFVTQETFELQKVLDNRFGIWYR